MNPACSLASMTLLALIPALLRGPEMEPRALKGHRDSVVKSESFDRDPGWEGHNNRLRPRVLPTIRQDFGYSGATHFASKEKGEIGGKVVRCATPAYYAARISKTLNDRLTASGTFALKAASGSSVHIGGPTRIGHYFQPSFTTARGTRGQPKRGPILVPGKVYNWSLVYDPDAGGGRGALQVTLGKETVTLALKPGQKGEGARFDRFGLFNSNIGGQLVRIYLDGLHYTAARPDR